MKQIPHFMFVNYSDGILTHLFSIGYSIAVRLYKA